MAQDTRIPVSVWHQGDEVGQQLVLALKEAMRESRSFLFVDHEIAPRSPRIVLYVASLKGDTTEASIAMASAIVYDHVSIPGLGIFLTSGVSSCGRDRVENCAKGILPNIDSAVEYLHRGWPDLWKGLIAGNLEYSEQQTPDAFYSTSAALSNRVNNP